MEIVITCTVPDDWRDSTHASGILDEPWRDIEMVLAGIGCTDLDIAAQE